MLEKGEKAPDFKLKDQDGVEHKLSDYKGKWVLLYFYPKDDTPGCTKEACSFRDNHDLFQNKNIVVIGVSKDSVKSHKKFSDKFSLPFDILSNESLDVIKSYRAYGKKKFMGREYMGVNRISYLIDPDGIIYKAFPKVKPTEHASEILEEMND